MLDERLFYSMTGFWAATALLSPCFVPRSENRGVIRCMLVCTAVSLYMSWLCTYLAQINPLLGPNLESEVLELLEHEWLPWQSVPANETGVAGH